MNPKAFKMLTLKIGVHRCKASKPLMVKLAELAEAELKGFKEPYYVKMSTESIHAMLTKFDDGEPKFSRTAKP